MPTGNNSEPTSPALPFWCCLEAEIMMFLNPPVVEIWISIDFQANDIKQKFDAELVRSLVSRYEEELPEVEAIYEETIRTERQHPHQLPKITEAKSKLKAIRAWNSQKSHAFQIEDDTIAYHIVKTKSDKPRYRHVREAIESKLPGYIDVFRPSSIKGAGLHYLDIVEIPSPPGGKLNLNEYFRHVVDLPEDPFGPIVDFSQAFQVKCAKDEGTLSVRIKSLPASGDASSFRFQMEWHKQSVGINTLQLSDVWSRMDVSHDYILECFHASLTESAIQLFNPTNEQSEE